MNEITKQLNAENKRLREENEALKARINRMVVKHFRTIEHYKTILQESEAPDILKEIFGIRK